MLKRLILVGGTMGVGKTSVCRELQALLPYNVFLDGDWCWDMKPFVVNDETKAMVLSNIGYLLRQFLQCSAYENIIFCWVMHRQEIWDAILDHVSDLPCKVHAVCLTCSEEALRNRLQQDITAGRRTGDVISRSLVRLPLYDALDIPQIDVTGLTAVQAAHVLAEAILKT